MADKSSPAATDTFVFDLREIISEVRQQAEKRKGESPDPLHLTDAEILELEFSFVLSEN